MIAKRTLHATNAEGSSLYLGPFGEPELASVWPFDLDSLIFPTEELDSLRMCTPTLFVDLMSEENPRYTSWGIYKAGMAATNFVGTVSIANVNYGSRQNPDYAKNVQELGTHIMRPEMRGKGIGTLAKLAALKFMMELRPVGTVLSYTAVSNLAAQRSLAKTGFTRTDVLDHYQYPGGAQTERWMLMRPEVISASQDLQDRQAALRVGWGRYQAQAGNLLLRQLD